ncbi:MAG: hypothetical protein GDA48_06215 [Hormoscilla sp. GM102CHS1]|nr:hypothetical protein [Hormoscilla sp. GM102CHS1]
MESHPVENDERRILRILDIARYLPQKTMITQVSNIQQGNNADSLTVTMSIGG